MSCVGSRLGACRRKNPLRSWDALHENGQGAVVKMLPFSQIISLNKDPKTQDSENSSWAVLSHGQIERFLGIWCPNPSLCRKANLGSPFMLLWPLISRPPAPLYDCYKKDLFPLGCEHLKARSEDSPSLYPLNLALDRVYNRCSIIAPQ